MNTYIFIGWKWLIDVPLETIPIGCWADLQDDRWYMVYPP